MFDDEPYGYDHDGDGWLDREDRGSFYGYDFDGDGDIDADDEFYGDMMMHEAGACFIATAVYGDYDHPQVRELRSFRDQVLMRSTAGRRFVRWYYRVGPGMADRFSSNEFIVRILKMGLDFWINVAYTFDRS